jgi:hypothetical protein
MIVLLNRRPDEVIAVNLDNVTSIEFRPHDVASIWFNLYNHEANMIDGIHLSGDAARQLFRFIRQHGTQPPNPLPYPGDPQQP